MRSSIRDGWRLLVLLVSTCATGACSSGGSSPAPTRGAEGAPASATAASTDGLAPPVRPAALGEPRAFHFVMPLGDVPHVVVFVDERDRAAAAGWIAPSEEVDRPRDPAAGFSIDESKLPHALRLRGTRMHLYAEDELVCDGVLGAPRLASVGHAALHATGAAVLDVAKVTVTIDEHAWEQTVLGERTLLFALDVPPACAERLSPMRTRVAWARDASLPAPVVVAKPQPATTPALEVEVAEVLPLVRGTPGFVRAQRSADAARIAYHRAPMPLEHLWCEEWSVPASWMRFTWNGEKRAYLSFVVECPPPHVRVGFELRETAAGALELLPAHSAVEGADFVATELDVVDPVALVDVDADGRLEVIESSEVDSRLRSFDGKERYARLELDHCR